MTGPTAEPLPDDIDALKALIVAQRAALRLAEAYAATAENEARARGLEIEKLRHTIARLRHERFGQSSERRALLDQLELQLFELEEDEAQAEASKQAPTPGVAVQSFDRRKPARRPLPEHLPRERVVHPLPLPARAAAGPCTSWART